MAPAPPSARTRPLLRGVSHLVAAVAAVPAVAGLVARARSSPGLYGAAVYGATLVILFASSAVYHRIFWRPEARRIVGRIDHSAIFLLIAGTYTPFCLLLGPGAGHVLLAVVWIAAALGIGVVITWDDAPKPLRAALYVLFGWFIVPVVPALRSAVGVEALRLLLAGGFIYTVGAVVYGLRRPDPFPRIFGFHEIFHLLVIAAATCHFLVVDAAVRALG
ncbi:MAG TPA: hemolysin III family protein [Anaeromyxobacteraceae bacterium]|nr:hemolysin III family protein [Anaeromyxobacteraceae bacterium]